MCNVLEKTVATILAPDGVGPAEGAMVGICWSFAAAAATMDEPRVGSGGFPSTAHAPAVLEGQAGGENEGLYAVWATPEGERVDH